MCVWSLKFARVLIGGIALLARQIPLMMLSNSVFPCITDHDSMNTSRPLEPGPVIIFKMVHFGRMGDWALDRNSRAHWTLLTLWCRYLAHVLITMARFRITSTDTMDYVVSATTTLTLTDNTGASLMKSFPLGDLASDHRMQLKVGDNPGPKP